MRSFFVFAFYDSHTSVGFIYSFAHRSFFLHGFSRIIPEFFIFPNTHGITTELIDSVKFIMYGVSIFSVVGLCRVFFVCALSGCLQRDCFHFASAWYEHWIYTSHSV